MDINILFEDNHILIAEKPSPLLTQPTDRDKNSLQTFLRDEIKNKQAKQGNVYLHCINRLDKKVSGIVIFAKSSKALKRLQKMQREQKFTKKYIAKLHGKLLEENGILTNYLIHDNYRAIITKSAKSNAKLASLSYKIIEYGSNSTFVLITLNTGRYHQIRAQFAHIHHPVIGDKKYKSIFDYKSIMLHHTVIDFTHPVTEEQMSFVSRPSFESELDAQLFDTHLKQLL